MKQVVIVSEKTEAQDIHIPNAKAFFKLLLSDSGQVSIKRVLALAVTIHYLITAFFATFVKTTIANTLIVSKILDIDAIIIGLQYGFITLEWLGKILVAKFNAVSAANNYGGLPIDQGSNVNPDIPETP